MLKKTISVRHQNRISSKMLLRAENEEEVKYNELLQIVAWECHQSFTYTYSKVKMPFSNSRNKRKQFVTAHKYHIVCSSIFKHAAVAA